MRSRFLLTASALSLVLLATGCSAALPQDPAPSDDPTVTGSPDAAVTAGPTPNATPATSLEAALSTTPATDNSTTYFGFTDLSAYGETDLESWLKATIAPGLQHASVLGTDVFAQFARVAPELLPDPAAADATAVSIGTPPYVTTRMTAVPNLERSFAEISGERSTLADGTLLVRREDLAFDMQDPDFPPGFIARLNVVWTGGDTLIAGSTRAGVTRWVSLEGPTLADHYVGLAECLGDSIGAVIASAESAQTSSDIGIAVGGEPDALVQTMCVQSADPAAEVDAIQARIAEGVDSSVGTPLVELLPDATVDATASWVRVRTPMPQSSTLLQMYAKGVLSDITG